ncbi:hypothetical protein L1987_54298 [Smallanthus sonchifolius]|uniref:Uncharacterized protein n=1 Tax=Smallanthus sonchifolius TaxID=185202 RepID=A0ACB9E6D3_9ASTR|nr:hypothetical protein L1987_54298 [Smallanthus sonchifolius]
MGKAPMPKGGSSRQSIYHFKCLTLFCALIFFHSSSNPPPKRHSRPPISLSRELSLDLNFRSKSSWLPSSIYGHKSVFTYSVPITDSLFPVVAANNHSLNLNR